MLSKLKGEGETAEKSFQFKTKIYKAGWIKHQVNLSEEKQPNRLCAWLETDVPQNILLQQLSGLVIKF